MYRASMEKKMRKEATGLRQREAPAWMSESSCRRLRRTREMRGEKGEGKLNIISVCKESSCVHTATASILSYSVTLFSPLAALFSFHSGSSLAFTVVLFCKARRLHRVNRAEARKKNCLKKRGATKMRRHNFCHPTMFDAFLSYSWCVFC